MKNRQHKGFTLIELLIVVAIIAILAAIAVPNFMEAQVRAKVSRCKNDMRSMATAMEAYKIDQNHYPPDSYPLGSSPWVILFPLSTPVAYMSSVPEDTFPEIPWNNTEATRISTRQYDYGGETFRQTASANPLFGGAANDTGRVWAVSTNGPDREYNMGVWLIFGEESLGRIFGILGRSTARGCLYDPTNGTISDGDIVRVGP